MSGYLVLLAIDAAFASVSLLNAKPEARVGRFISVFLIFAFVTFLGPEIVGHLTTYHAPTTP